MSQSRAVSEEITDVTGGHSLTHALMYLSVAHEVEGKLLDYISEGLKALQRDWVELCEYSLTQFHASKMDTGR